MTIDEQARFISEGYAAFEAGQPQRACSYTDADERWYWLKGWADAVTAKLDRENPDLEAPMYEERARKILAGFVGTGPDIDMNHGNGTRDVAYARWSPDRGTKGITLDGRFSADELEAFAWWMRNHAATP